MYRYVKRVFDFCAAFAALIVLSPVMLVTAVIIKRVSRGPVIFKQPRIGMGGREFTVFKFRTMDVETHRDGVRLSDEERSFKFGLFMRRTSIDELPQFVNILIGDMSFIGPRPLLVRFVPYYTEEEFHRHDVLPGITGLAQINGRNNAPWETRFAYDLEYVRTMSFKVDFAIFLKTVKYVLSRSDITFTDLMDFEQYRKDQQMAEAQAKAHDAEAQSESTSAEKSDT